MAHAERRLARFAGAVANPMIGLMRLLIVWAVLLAWAVSRAGAAAPEPSPEGLWLTENKDGVVEIYRCGDRLCGKLAWLRLKPGGENPRALDINNPDPTRRDQPLCGLAFMQDFRMAGPTDWEDGSIYDPRSGDTYHTTLALQPDGALRLRGYIGISLFGRSEVWTRYTQPLPSCPTR